MKKKDERKKSGLYCSLKSTGSISWLQSPPQSLPDRLLPGSPTQLPSYLRATATKIQSKEK